MQYLNITVLAFSIADNIICVYVYGSESSLQIEIFVVHIDVLVNTQLSSDMSIGKYFNQFSLLQNVGFTKGFGIFRHSA
jgi:hypothetical protein